MPTQEEQYKTILSHYLPATAVDPIYSFIVTNAVHFRISASRTSKLGDYRMPQQRHPFHEISVNGDLSPHLFLLVLLHEMAHLKTFLLYGRQVAPHGHEWQEQYRQLIIQYRNGGHFPQQVIPLLDRYTSHIPLHHPTGQQIERMLKQLDSPGSRVGILTLSELPIGSTFRLSNRPTMLFRNIEKRRTRHLCIDVRTGTRYLINGAAEIILPDTI